MCLRQWLPADQHRARHQQACAGDYQCRLQATAQVAADRRQQRTAQLADGKARGQQPGAALIAVRGDVPQACHHQLHARQERQPAEHYTQCQAHAITWLMWRKGMLGANLNAWIDLQQEGKTRQAQEPRAIA